MGEHGIHIAAADGKAESRTAQLPERIGFAPVWLGDDAHAEASGLQGSPHHRHGEAGMVHVGVTGDQDDIHLEPTSAVSFFQADRQWGATHDDPSGPDCVCEPFAAIRSGPRSRTIARRGSFSSSFTGTPSMKQRLVTCTPRMGYHYNIII
jgi:hypothetical protein